MMRERADDKKDERPQSKRQERGGEENGADPDPEQSAATSDGKSSRDEGTEPGDKSNHNGKSHIAASEKEGEQPNRSSKSQRETNTPGSGTSHSEASGVSKTDNLSGKHKGGESKKNEGETSDASKKEASKQRFKNPPQKSAKQDPPETPKEKPKHSPSNPSKDNSKNTQSKSSKGEPTAAPKTKSDNASAKTTDNTTSELNNDKAKTAPKHDANQASSSSQAKPSKTSKPGKEKSSHKNGEKEDAQKNKETQKKGEKNNEKGSNPEEEEEQEEVGVAEEFDAGKDAEALHSATKGMGTDEKMVIQIMTSRTSEQRQDIRKAYLEKYEVNLMDELESELSGDFKDLLVDLLRLPWERELHALRASMGTNERLLVHVLLTHSALSTADLAQKYKDAYGKDLLKTLETETSGDLKRLLTTVFKIRLGKQKPDKRSGDDIAKKLFNGGRPLLQTKVTEAMDILATASDKMAAICTRYKELSGHDLEEDIQKHLSGETQMALLAIVSWSLDPGAYTDDVLYRSLVGEITFRVFSLLLAESESEIGKLRERFEAKHDKSLTSVAEKELAGEVRTLFLAVLSRDQDGRKGEK